MMSIPVIILFILHSAFIIFLLHPVASKDVILKLISATS